MSFCGKVRAVSLAVLLGHSALTDAQQYECDGWTPTEGPMSGVMPSTTGRPKLIFGMDVDYPPYAYLRKPPFGSTNDLDEVVGVGADMINAMAAHCGFDAVIMQAKWSDCWGSTDKIGQGLLKGWYHGCMTYTHPLGVRNRFLEFSNSWAIPNKPSGLIAKLGGGATPATTDGTSNLAGKKVVDVSGWAPTADVLAFVKNQCTDTPYTNYTLIQGSAITVSGTALGANDKALMAVLQELADVMWIYADQAANYHCAKGTTQEGWDCDMWGKFGEDFAYIQTGMFGWLANGTTVSMSKKGSGVAKFLDACMESWMPTQNFLDTCKLEHGSPPHSQLTTCVPNSLFPDDNKILIEDMPSFFPTIELQGKFTCADGYCNCGEVATIPL